jgi:hypothetical protein
MKRPSGVIGSRAKLAALVSIAPLLVSLSISSGCGSADSSSSSPKEVKNSRIYKLSHDRIENAAKAAPGKKATKPGR